MSKPTLADLAPQRDLRLDFFRGLCLVMIFINHVPGTVYELITSRNFGFSDAAEGFVMMAGIAAALAYSKHLRHSLHWQGIGKIWRRAWTLYIAHLTVSLIVLGVISFGVTYMDAATILDHNQLGLFLYEPFGVRMGLPLLGYQLSYVNILPMYIVLLLATPFIIWAGLRWPLRVWAGSVVVWYIVGRFELNMPNYPQHGGWFFNPLAWEILFTTGVLTGLAMKNGRRLVPVWPWLQALTGFYLLFALVATQWPALNSLLGHSLWLLQEKFHLSQLFTAFDKTYVSGPRLLHILALTYFLSSWPILSRLSASTAMKPLLLLGRNSLPVFALGTILSLAAQVIKHSYEAGFALDSVLIIGGIMAMMGFAWILEKGRLSTR